MTSPALPAIASFLFGNTSVNPSDATSLVAGAGLPYRYSKPKNLNPALKYAVVLFFHGTGEEGTDGVSHLTAGNNTGHGALYFLSTANPENADNFPCFFIAPQIPAGANWSDDTAGAWICSLYKTFTAVFGASIDATRWYLTGLSEGGFGAYDQPFVQTKGQFLGKNPFAAIVPLSGNMFEFSQRAVTTQPKIPIWSFHGVADPTVPPAADDTNVAALLAAGYQVIKTRYATGQHDIWEVAYQHPLLLPWLFSQRLGQPSPGLPNPAAYVNGVRTDYGGVTTDSGAAAPPAPTTVIVEYVTNLSQGKTVTVSSTENGTNVAANAVDGNPATRWSSLYADPQWLAVDLGTNYIIAEVDLTWETACAKNYLIQTSMDGINWTTQATVTGNAKSGLLKYPLATPPTARYVRMYGTARATAWGYSLFELVVLGG